mmetsp:Transcript_22561/g.40001  ORF Transcript_22561/g.40001 Transcript_22561/m.40001 type:complete len:276 (-) Transcript_22561:68-895(-)
MSLGSGEKDSMCGSQCTCDTPSVEWDYKTSQRYAGSASSALVHKYLSELLQDGASSSSSEPDLEEKVLRKVEQKFERFTATVMSSLDKRFQDMEDSIVRRLQANAQQHQQPPIALQGGRSQARGGPIPSKVKPPNLPPLQAQENNSKGQEKKPVSKRSKNQKPRKHRKHRKPHLKKSVFQNSQGNEQPQVSTACPKSLSPTLPLANAKQAPPKTTQASSLSEEEECDDHEEVYQQPHYASKHTPVYDDDGNIIAYIPDYLFDDEYDHMPILVGSL